MSQFIWIMSGNWAKEIEAEMISDDVAIHPAYKESGWSITHVPTGFVLIHIDECFTVHTVRSIARRFVELLKDSVKYEGPFGDASEAGRWNQKVINANPEYFEDWKNFRFFQPHSHYYWLDRNWKL